MTTAATIVDDAAAHFGYAGWAGDGPKADAVYARHEAGDLDILAIFRDKVEAAVTVRLDEGAEGADALGDVDIEAIAAEALAEAEPAAITSAASAADIEAVLDRLNGYDEAGGDNIWQDVILGIDGYDDDASLALGAERTSDVFVAYGVEYRYVAQQGEWVAE